jgi:hypothetical protein
MIELHDFHFKIPPGKNSGDPKIPIQPVDSQTATGFPAGPASRASNAPKGLGVSPRRSCLDLKKVATPPRIPRILLSFSSFYIPVYCILH